ncbi:MAG: rod shape-determining protein RodA [Prolixibacteraceae bacterium]|nr:rod shape-determining protein RodA [Prolixibacteraceae bacterium]
MRRNNTFLNLDWIVIVLYLFMVLAGWLNIYSAVYNEEHNNIFDLSQRYGKQLMWIGFALMLALFVIVVDSKFYVTFSYLFYALFILLLIIVLFFGKEVNGSKSWFVIGNFAFQPAEFAKYGTALAISKLLSTYNFSLKIRQNQLIAALIILLPVALIILQNDTGSALVYLIFIIPLFREGMSGLILFFGVYFTILFIGSLVMSPVAFIVVLLLLSLLVAFYFLKRWLPIGKVVLLLLAISMPFAIYQILAGDGSFDLYFVLIRSSFLTALLLLFRTIVKRIQHMPLITAVFLVSIVFSVSVDFAFNRFLEPHQQDRINHLLGIESDPLGAGYNVNQSKIAIGSGGFLGKGFLKGTQTKYDFVPEQSTDFIFCTVGEEWGFVGSLLVVAAFVWLLIRLVQLAERQRSKYSRVFGYSVAAILFFHFAINIGMTIGVAPVIGIPLPFFSYGGSSLWFFTILLFTFLRLDASRLEQLH